MAYGLMDKLTNFLMPVEEEEHHTVMTVPGDRRTQLKVHAPAALKVYVTQPQVFDDVKVCADCLKSNIALVVNYDNADATTQQRIGDFLAGVCFITGSSSQRVSETVMLYVPGNVDINKELYAYSIPTYIKRRS